MNLSKIRPLNVHVGPGSPAEKAIVLENINDVDEVHSEAIVSGIRPTPDHDLIFHGGKTIPNLSYTNFYVGGTDSWDPTDIKNIDKALESAMSDDHLNNVMVQYFHGDSISAIFKGSKVLQGTKPATVSQKDVESMVSEIYQKGMLHGLELGSTVCNFMLPRGTILTLGDPSGESIETDPEKSTLGSLLDADEAASSRLGLGGYHGSIHVKNQNRIEETVYYAVGVYSEKEMADGSPNGIPVFDEPWKNIVTTFYHELQEARTDPDVEDAIRNNDDSYLGWMSEQGFECGDFPMKEVTFASINKIIKEVQLADGSGTVPVQFQYSNAVHGPEGPIQAPHAIIPSFHENTSQQML